MFRFKSIFFAILGLLTVTAFTFNLILGIVLLAITIGVYLMSLKSAAAYYARQYGTNREIQISKLTDLDIDPAVASFNRGKFRYQTENFKLAIEDFNRAIEINDRYAEAIYYRALSFHNSGDFVEAKQDLMRALSFCDVEVDRTLYDLIHRRLQSITDLN
jgi:tetratricopeptide (TPR) repeat protein